MSVPAAPSDLPRVLVVTSNNFNFRGGGGITLSNLFRGWPVDRLANVHEDPTPPDRSVCANDYRLTRREVRWLWPLSIVERVAAPRDGDGDTDTRALAPPSSRRAWTRALAGDGVPRDVTLSPLLDAWVTAFRPQLVYGFLGSLAQIRLVRLAADRWRVPVAVHMMDDWPTVIYTNGLLSPLFRRLILREFREVLDRSSARLAISTAMADEYSSRYGHPFAVFNNALDVKEWMKTSRREWSVNRPAILRYVGSIFAEAQRDAIRDVCEAVSALRRSGVQITLALHAPAAHAEPLRAWGFGSDVVRFESEAAPAEVPALLATADVLLLPFNFDERSTRYIRLSMPTKVPAYMVSGTPVLAYGRRGVAAIDYADSGGWGLAVTERDVESLKTSLGRLITHLELRESLGRRAMALAAQNHEIGSVRARFWSTLALAAKDSRDVIR